MSKTVFYSVLIGAAGVFLGQIAYDAYTKRSA